MDRYEYRLITDEVSELTEMSRDEVAEELGESRSTHYTARKHALHVTKSNLEHAYALHDELSRQKSPFPASTHDHIHAIERAICAGQSEIQNYLKTNLRTLKEVEQLRSPGSIEHVGAAYALGFAQFYRFLRIDRSDAEAGREAVRLLRIVHDWCSANPAKARPYLKARVTMRLVAAQFNLVENEIAVSTSAREAMCSLLRETDFLNLVRQIAQKVPGDPLPVYNGLLAAATLGDDAAVDEFFALLVNIDPKFRNPSFAGHGTGGLATEPIIKKFYLNRLQKEAKS